MKLHKNPAAKFYGFAAIFVLICLIYVFRLAGLQLSGAHSVPDEYVETTTRTVTIQALRGDICDRNGKILATTKRTYALNFDYLTLGDTKAKTNATILRAVLLLEESGNADKRTADNFPFVGTYPELSFNADALNRDTKTYSQVQRVIALNEWSEIITADEFIERFVKKHKLDEKGADGKPLFSDEEITKIIRVRYDMELTQFSYMQPYTLAEGLDLSFVAKVKESGGEGIFFETSSEREYLYDGYASHILGRVGKILAENWEDYRDLGYSYDSFVGISGCEYAFEEYLRGVDGELTIVEDADGNVVESYVSKEPIAGKDVRLTIDIDLQIAAEDGLKKNVERYSVVSGKKSGAITAIDPKSGKVLAIASYPTYNLGSFNEDYESLSTNSASPLTNRALNGRYAPGSTFKIAVSYAALESGTVTRNTCVRCDGVYTKYSGQRGPKCWIYTADNNWQTHGDQTVADAIKNSCNCYFYEIGDRMGIDTLNEYCRRLGFGSKTGIELGETSGILAGKLYVEKNGLGAWYPGDTLAASIGQSYNSFTPIQITMGISTVISGGNRYEAQLLDSVYTFEGELVYKKEAVLIDKVDITATNLSIIKNAMKTMAESNSTVAYYMDGLPVSVGGKTGTSQTGTYYDDALFTSFAPVDDPEIVVTCVIERGVSGANASMAVAALYEEYFKDR